MALVRVHPLKNPGAWPKNLTTWGHKLQGISMNSQDPLHVLGQGHSKPSKASFAPLFLPCVVCLVALSNQPSTRNISPSPLLRWRVRTPAQGSSFQNPNAQNQSLSNANGTARETNSVGTEQPMPASQIPEGLQTAKGSPAIQSAGLYLLSIDHDAQNRSKQLIGSSFAR